MTHPPVALVRQFDTHRLVSSRYLPRGDSVLVAISDDDAHLQAIFELDAATNDRVRAGQQLLPGIGVEELVCAVPHAAVINAAFCHPHPLGSRFNAPDRGAWYAAFALETAQAEVGFHTSVQLAEIGRFEDTVTYDDYIAHLQPGACPNHFGRIDDVAVLESNPAFFYVAAWEFVGAAFLLAQQQYLPFVDYHASGQVDHRSQFLG